MPIYDEELLKKENITIENSTKEFNNYLEKISNLKNKVENEILKLDELYEKTNKEMTKSFEEKHLNLTKEENEMREKLQNEVTKVKEKLEINFSNLNTLIRNCEKINKGIKILEKEEKQMIRILSYVSKINKNKKEMKNLFKEKMKNLSIKYDEKEQKIIYNEYYFNGFQNIIKSIEFKDVSFDKINIAWKLEDINELDIKKIKYKVETRKEDIDDKFELKYEGKESTCLINNLDINVSYEVRIGIIYDNIPSNYYEIKKVETKQLNSAILNESNKSKEFLDKIQEWTKFKKLELIYRGTRDGMNSYSFHNKCDNKGPTICLYKNESNHIFGAYASISWTKAGDWKTATESFLFTLTNVYNIEPNKFAHSEKDKVYSVYHNNEFGPSFGAGRDISIANDFTKGDSYANFPSTYIDNIGKGNSIFSSNLKLNKFKLKEVEVFKIN